MAMLNILCGLSASYVSAPCGSGKTHVVCEYVAQNFDLANYLITCPTIKLMDETRLKLEAAGANVTCINHETQVGRLRRAIINLLQEGKRG